MGIMDVLIASVAAQILVAERVPCTRTPLLVMVGLVVCTRYCDTGAT